jgi:hypothetical protein
VWYNKGRNNNKTNKTNTEGMIMSNNLLRANRVAVKANGENFVADFYKTHKAVGSIYSEVAGWEAPENANKTLARESFRLWAIENCEAFGIEWDPSDKRAPQNIRKAKYDSDESLIDDAMGIALPEMKALAEKCKYGVEWAGLEHDDIVPMTHTGSGRDLSTMGIEDGKYLKSGNWAWASIKFITNLKFKGEECYLPVSMQLVSGQLKKVGMGITEFNSKVKAEIINAGLATEEELDPPKESKPKKSSTPKEKPVLVMDGEVITDDTDTDEVVSENAEPITVEAPELVVVDTTKEEEEVAVDEVQVEEEPKKSRSRKSKRIQEVE